MNFMPKRDRAISVLLVSDDEAEFARLQALLAGGAGTGIKLAHATPGPGVREIARDHDLCLLAAEMDSPAAVEMFAAGGPAGPPVIALIDSDDEFALAEARAAGAVDALPRRKLPDSLLGAAMRYAVAHRDAETRLAALALYDPETGLAGQPMIWAMLDHGLARARRDKSSLAVMLIYIEGLGAVNESLGYAAGDTALAAIASRLKALLRASDTVGRFAGTKLVVILETMTETADVQLVAEKITSAIAEPMTIDGADLALGSTIGIALFPSTANTAEALIRGAAEAMDAAKDKGAMGVHMA